MLELLFVLDEWQTEFSENFGLKIFAQCCNEQEQFEGVHRNTTAFKAWLLMLIHIIKVIKSDHLLGHNGAKGFMITDSNLYLWINLEQ